MSNFDKYKYKTIGITLSRELLGEKTGGTLEEITDNTTDKKLFHNLHFQVVVAEILRSNFRNQLNGSRSPMMAPTGPDTSSGCPKNSFEHITQEEIIYKFRVQAINETFFALLTDWEFCIYCSYPI